MNGNQIIRFVLRMFLNRGANAAIRHAANRGQDPQDMTPQQRAQAKATRKQMQSARKGMNVARRLMR